MLAWPPLTALAFKVGFMLPLPHLRVVYSRTKSFFGLGPGRREWFVLGSLDGIRVSAIPDTGSDLDIVSVDFVRRHGITIDTTSQRFIQLPNGKIIATSTVSLPFLFDGENSTFSRVFTVMPNCLHDVILSNSFLRTTETLTKFSRRLRSRFVPTIHVPRLRLLGTPRHRIWGSINGRNVAAIPDTGSDVMLMSKRYARKLGLKISKVANHRTCLEFADGTLANTCGMVFGVEWRFGGQDSTSQYCDFHIMEDLPYKVILSNDFLFKSKAFSKFKDFFFEQRNDVDLSRSFHELSLIKIVGPQNKAISRIHGFYRRFLRIVKGSE
jgi:Aspartyl protease